MNSFLRRFLIVPLVGLIALGFSAKAQAEEHPHPFMLHAWHELKEAHKELKESRLTYGGHKEAAMKDINHAVEQIEKALKEDGGIKLPKDYAKSVDYKQYANHPHLHHSLHELKEAHKELKEAKHDFHGHREEAIKAVDKAMEQIELLIKKHFE